MIKITKPAKIIIAQENLDLSIFSGIGASLESITPDQKQIPRQKKINTSSFDFKKGTNSRNSQC